MPNRPHFSKPRWSRRILVVKRALQLKIAFFTAVIVLITGAALIADFYYLFGKIFVDAYADLPWQTAFWNSLPLMGLHVGLLVLLGGLLAVFMSHRFAGPIYRLEESAKRLAQGDFSFTITLRQGDDLAETAEALNQMIITLRDHIQRDKNLTERSLSQIDKILRQLEKYPAAESNLREEIENLKREIAYLGSAFRT